MDLSFLLSWVLITLATISLVVFVSLFLVVRAVYKRLRRSRALSGAVLRSRTRLSWGPQHEVLKLQLRLTESLASGQAAVDLARQSTGPLGELPRLFRRIQSEGASVLSQLRLLASETDSVALAEAIPVTGRRVDRVTGLVRRLRAAVSAGLGDLTDDSLTTLHSDVEHEVAALRAGVEELRSLNGRDDSPPTRRPDPVHHLSRKSES